MSISWKESTEKSSESSKESAENEVGDFAPVSPSYF